MLYDYVYLHGASRKKYDPRPGDLKADALIILLDKLN